MLPGIEHAFHLSAAMALFLQVYHPGRRPGNPICDIQGKSTNSRYLALICAKAPAIMEPPLWNDKTLSERGAQRGLD